MSRIELRKEQQRLITSSTRSFGLPVGDCASFGRQFPNPGLNWPDGIARYESVLQLDGSYDLRAVREDGDPVNAVLPVGSGTLVTGSGAVIRNADDLQLWRRIDLSRASGSGPVVVEPSFEEFSSPADIRKIRVTFESAFREDATRTTVVTSSTSYEWRFAAVPPRWGPPTRNLPRGPVSGGPQIGRIVGSYRTSQEAYASAKAFNDLAADNNDEFGARVAVWNWAFDPKSSKLKEGYAGGGSEGSVILWVALGVVVGRYTLHAYGYEGSQVPGLSLQGVSHNLYPQLSGWQPPRTVSRFGVPTGDDAQEAMVPAPDLELVVQFWNAQGSSRVRITRQIPNVNSFRTIEIDSDALVSVPEPLTRVTLDLGKFRSWLKFADVPLPRLLNEATTTSYSVTRLVDGTGDPPLLTLFGGSRLLVPSNATLSGAPPHQYLAYPTDTSRDGDIFTATNRCRCPAVMLWNVLRDLVFGISQDLSSLRIDSTSFVTASRYCQALINGRPRWAYDGILEGTQIEIITELLRCCRGWLVDARDGRIALKVESPVESTWIVCPAMAVNGEIRYRRALPRTTVRALYLNRLTGVDAVTPGRPESRVEEVPWQDPDVCQRWAAWQTFQENNLLETVEFTLTWEAHAITVGDVISVFDPARMGIRMAGRVLSSDTQTVKRWVQLDSFPFEYWPELTATAELLQTSPRNRIDPELWGYTLIRFPLSDGPPIVFQTPDGGLAQARISEVAWLPGGRPDQNRVTFQVAPTVPIPDRSPWSIERPDLHPTKWRVESVSEDASGTQFAVVASRYIDGMHDHVEQGKDLPTRQYRWIPNVDTEKLSTFQGKWDDLSQRYPRVDPREQEVDAPFRLPNPTFDGLGT